MATIFVPPAYRATVVSTAFFSYLESLNSNIMVLLGFPSPGPEGHHIDCAILSPKGVDLLEIRDRAGKLTATAQGSWLLADERGVTQLTNDRDGSENPFVTASAGADDLKAGLEEMFGRDIPVYPLVLIPNPNPQSTFERHKSAYHANGIDDLGKPGRLRALGAKRGSTVWRGREHEELVEALGLVELSLAHIKGRLLDEATGNGIGGAKILFSGIQVAQESDLASDPSGRFEATLPIGRLEIRLEPPAPFAHHSFSYSALQGPNPLAPIRLTGGNIGLLEHARSLRERALSLSESSLSPRARAQLDEITTYLHTLETQVTDSSSVNEADAERLRSNLEQLTFTLEELLEPQTTAPVDTLAADTAPSRGRNILTFAEDEPVVPDVVRPQRAVLERTERKGKHLKDRGRVTSPRSDSARRSLLPFLLVLLLAAGAGAAYLYRDTLTSLPLPRFGNTATAPSEPTPPSTITPLSLPESTLQYQTLPASPLNLAHGVAPINRFTCPASHPLKGLVIQDRRVYVRRGQGFYNSTAPEWCFATPTAAAAAGYSPREP